MSGTGGSSRALLFLEYSFSRKLDFVAVFADALDHDLLSFAQLVAYVANPAVGDLGNVQQAVGPGKDFDESAKVDDSRDSANVGRANFGFRGQTANPINRSLCGGA